MVNLVKSVKGETMDSDSVGKAIVFALLIAFIVLAMIVLWGLSLWFVIICVGNALAAKTATGVVLWSIFPALAGAFWATGIVRNLFVRSK